MIELSRRIASDRASGEFIGVMRLTAAGAGRFLAAFDADRLRAILAPDLRFDGSITGRRVGAEPFIAGAAAFASAARRITMLQREPTAALYDAELPGGTVRFAEFFQVADGRIHLWVGGGIVWDSDPDAEIEESWVKARPLLAAVGGLVRA